MLSDREKAAMLDAIAAYAHSTPFAPEVGAYVLNVLDESAYGLPEHVRERRAAARERRDANERLWRR